MEGDVNFLFDEQVIQDERLLILEQENDVIDDELESEFMLFIFNKLQQKPDNLLLFGIISLDLLATTISLDFRVTTLEENGGSDGNSSVAELEVRVETLEGTAADHEVRISTTEIDMDGR